MANSTIPNLVAVTVPALTDLFGVRQSGDTRDKKLTATQLLSLVPAAGDVFKVGTPSAGLFGVWTGDGTIEAVSEVTLGGGVLNINPGTETRVTGDLRLLTGSGQAPMLVDELAGETNPTVCPAFADQNTGLGWLGGDRLSIISGGVSGLVLAELNGAVIPRYDTEPAMTAFAGGGQGSAVQLDHGYNVVVTVATTGDSVKLPIGVVFLQGSVVYIKNDGVNALDLFPGSGDNLGAGVDTAISVAAGASVAFIGKTADSIWTQLIFAAGGGGGGDVTKVGTPVDNQIGIWTGDGTIEGDTALTFESGILNATGVRAGSGTEALPAFSFIGETSLGFRNVGSRIGVSVSGVTVFNMEATAMFTQVGAALMNEAPSSTNPTLVILRTDLDTGIGQNATDQVSIIAGGVELLRAVEVVGANQVIVSPGVVVDDAVTPVLAFGDGDSGFYENADDFISVALAGVRHFAFGVGSNGFGGIISGAGRILNEATTATNPTLIPFNTDVDSGIGQNASDQVSLIGGGVELARAVEVSGANQFIIAPIGIQDNAAFPSLAFGDGDSGFYESFEDTIRLTLGGTARWVFTGDRFVAHIGNGPSLQNEASTATNPTLIPALGDPSTGIGGVTGGLNVIVGGVNAMQFDQAASVVTIRAEGKIHGFLGTVSAPGYAFRLNSNTGMYSGGASSDELKFSAGGVEALVLKELNAGVIQVPNASVGVTANAGGGQGSATQLNRTNNVLASVASGGDSVKLPPVFLINSIIFIKNDGANAADVFPASGDDLGAGVDTAVSLAVGESISFIALVANATWTPWIVSVGGGGGGDVTKVGTPVDNQIGVWTGDGTIEGTTSLVLETAALECLTRYRGANGAAGAPGFSFTSDTNTGLFRQSAGIVGISCGGAGNWLFRSTSFDANQVGSPRMMFEVTSASNPVFIPSLLDTDTGLGSGAADQLDLIAGGLSCISVRETGGARQVGFYTTAPISLQTGVAVSSAGIHAALVALGLITA